MNMQWVEHALTIEQRTNNWLFLALNGAHRGMDICGDGPPDNALASIPGQQYFDRTTGRSWYAVLSR